MVVGNTDRIAAEFELLETTGRWYFGSLRFWFGGHECGEYHHTSDLASSVRAAKEFLAASQRRSRAQLDDRSAEEVWWLLYGRFTDAVVSESAASTAPRATARDSWGDITPHLFDEVGESALRDRYSVVIVRRGDGADRVIVHEWMSASTTETVLAAGLLDVVVSQYCQAVETVAGRAFEPSAYASE